MFKIGVHYNNRRFDFKVLQINGNKLFVPLENGRRAILNKKL